MEDSEVAEIFHGMWETEAMNNTEPGEGTLTGSTEPIKLSMFMISIIIESIIKERSFPLYALKILSNDC